MSLKMHFREEPKNTNQNMNEQINTHRMEKRTRNKNVVKSPDYAIQEEVFLVSKNELYVNADKSLSVKTRIITNKTANKTNDRFLLDANKTDHKQENILSEQIIKLDLTRVSENKKKSARQLSPRQYIA